MATKKVEPNLHIEPCDGCGKPISGFWITEQGHVCDDCYRKAK